MEGEGNAAVLAEGRRWVVNASLRELAKEYDRRTEEYDRTVCTGPIKDNAIMPMHPGEYALIQANARRVLAEMIERAAAIGYSRAELFDAICENRYDGKGAL